MLPVTLEELIILATKAHAGQMDKAGKSYINHVLRVYLGVETWEEQQLALIHDIIEDSPAYANAILDPNAGDPLAVSLKPHLLEALLAITRGGDQGYKAYIYQVGQNELATKVKLADLKDHLRDTSVLSESQIKKYQWALEYLRDLWY